jgi:hypothetical protein
MIKANNVRTGLHEVFTFICSYCFLLPANVLDNRYVQFVHHVKRDSVWMIEPNLECSHKIPQNNINTNGFENRYSSTCASCKIWVVPDANRSKSVPTDTRIRPTPKLNTILWTVSEMKAYGSTSILRKGTEKSNKQTMKEITELDNYTKCFRRATQNKKCCYMYTHC